MATPRKFEDLGGLAVVVLGCLVGWVLAFLYEGPTLYAMVASRGVDGLLLNAVNLCSLTVGLLFGILIRFTSFPQLKSLIGTLLLSCLALSLSVPWLPGLSWYVIFPILSLAAGVCISLWGHLARAFVPSKKRRIAVAVVMLSASSALTLSHIATTQISVYLGYAFAEGYLAAALFCLWKMPSPQRTPDLSQRDSPRYILRHFGALLCFILCITMNAGFMFQSIYPLFAEHETLLSFYINIPYMLAIAVLALFKWSNRAQTLYTALALWGFALLMISHMDLSILSFFVITTTMLFASGMLDFFWWTIFASSLDAVKNPATPVGIILAANIFGSLLGGQTSNILASRGVAPGDMAQLGLIFVLFNMVLLSIVSKKLLPILPDADFLKHPTTPAPEDRLAVAREKLSPREMDVFLLLLDGASDKMIGEQLHISLNTIKSHNRKIFAKLGMPNRVELRRHYSAPRTIESHSR